MLKLDCRHCINILCWGEESRDHFIHYCMLISKPIWARLIICMHVYCYDLWQIECKVLIVATYDRPLRMRQRTYFASLSIQTLYQSPLQDRIFNACSIEWTSHKHGITYFHGPTGFMNYDSWSIGKILFNASSHLGFTHVYNECTWYQIIPCLKILT